MKMEYNKVPKHCVYETVDSSYKRDQKIEVNAYILFSYTLDISW
jgi:hypothetical protein